MPLPLLAWLPSAIAAAGSAGGAIMQNASAKARAREQMAFQERMSSTSFQRGVDDMRQAGLNPMLAYQQGGASSPGGAMPQTSDVVGPAVSSAMQMKRFMWDLRLAEAEHKKVTEDTRAAMQRGNLDLANKDLSEEHLKQEKIHTTMLGLELPAVSNAARVERSPVGKVAPFIDRIRDTLLPFLQLGKQGGPMGRPFGLRGSSIRGR